MNDSAQAVAPGVFLVAGPRLTDSRDCLCYLVAGQRARVLIDCGAGPSAADILRRAEQAGGGPPSHLLITHAHIDHAGGAAAIKQASGCSVLIHHDDAPVLAAGDTMASAADWYGLPLPPCQADWALQGGEALELGPDKALNIVHTPGHTPGSLAAWCLADGEKVLFGQDVHGPFMAQFGSDLAQWASSMQVLLDLRADVLCEGHYGVFRPAPEVRRFIEGHLRAQGF